MRYIPVYPYKITDAWDHYRLETGIARYRNRYMKSVKKSDIRVVIDLQRDFEFWADIADRKLDELGIQPLAPDGIYKRFNRVCELYGDYLRYLREGDTHIANQFFNIVCGEVVEYMRYFGSLYIYGIKVEIIMPVDIPEYEYCPPPKDSSVPRGVIPLSQMSERKLVLRKSR